MNLFPNDGKPRSKRTQSDQVSRTDSKNRLGPVGRAQSRRFNVSYASLESAHASLTSVLPDRKHHTRQRNAKSSRTLREPLCPTGCTHSAREARRPRGVQEAICSSFRSSSSLFAFCTLRACWERVKFQFQLLFTCTACAYPCSCCQSDQRWRFASRAAIRAPLC